MMQTCTVLDSYVITVYSGRHGNPSETLIIPEVGHSAYWEQPDIFNHVVLAFIQRADRQARSEV